MRKGAAIVLALSGLASLTALWAGPVPVGPSDRRGITPALFAQAGGPAATGFSLAEAPRGTPPPGPPSLDLQAPADTIAAGTPPEPPAAGLKGGAGSAPLSVSFFLGPRGGDVFAALHRAYAWKPLSRSLTLGLGVYREIPISRGFGLLPYVGIIRASAILSLPGRDGNRESIEYRLTAFCVGLPLVIRFN